MNIFDRPGVAGAVLGQLRSGDRFTPVGMFPNIAERHAWWHIMVESSGPEGWALENHTWFEAAP